MKGAKGCTRRYQSWCDRLEAPKDWLAAGRALLLRVVGSVCVAATTLCVTERDNQQAQVARCKRGTVASEALARNKTWCEQKTRRSVSEVGPKTASAENSSTVFPPKNITGS